MQKEKSILTLKEAFRKGLVKVGDYIDYQPISATCTLSQEKTGWEEEQTFSTESLRWRLDEFEGKLILVAASVTKQKLTLKGKKGYNNGVETQNELCETLYSNQLISLKVVSITEEIRNLPAECNIILGPYWLASRWSNYADFNVRRLDAGHVLGSNLWDSNDDTVSPAYAVRPVVFLKSGIKINLEQGDGSKKKPWGICEEDNNVNSEVTEKPLSSNFQAMQAVVEETTNSGEKEAISETKLELMQLIQAGKKLLERAKKMLKKM